jgi:SAM-dependent methyltransferase
MQASAFRSGAFDVVLSCSTMEHGVSWPLFLAEAARLLRPGGLLYVSTDLVDDDADPSWVEAFGLPWQPLRVADVGTIVESLDSNGFRAPAPLDIELPETLPHEFFGVPLAFIALVATKHP